MGTGITINLFENFEILKDGEPILLSLSNTRKTKMFLAYLIVNKDRIVSHKELFELLWTGQEYANPGTALRTLLYRYRSLISENKIDELEKSIISKRGAYQWNQELNVDIDIYDFEDYASAGLNKVLSKEKRVECLKKAIDLYRGPLLKDSSEEHWVVAKAVHYRDIYVKAVLEYVSLLKESGDKSELVEILENAIKIAGHADILELELSLAKGGKNTGEATNKYEIMSKHLDVMNEEIDKLQKDMESDDFAENAFVCDFNTFKDIYHLQRRLLARTGETMYVSLITIGFVGKGSKEGIRYERVMKALLESTKKCLRCGDSICRYSDSCLAVMFPAGAYEDANKILDRIKSKFIPNVADSDVVLSYKIRPLKNIKD
ncbi:MAG: BTAD domain-containing putative transcriptional regulator [Lachnospiraceae bacterium]|nr:BTAD domain-containing putative transcriptional regulator [Lachnospiraceae bacterium]